MILLPPPFLIKWRSMVPRGGARGSWLGGGKLKIYRLRKNYRLKFFFEEKVTGKIFLSQ